jgi:amidase
MGRLVRVSKEHVFYSFDPGTPPAAKAAPGDLVEFECLDALGGQVTDEHQALESIDWGRVNPATGPVYVDGAEAGDALAVRILSIELANQGVIVTIPGEGALPHRAREARTRICRISGDLVEFLGFKLKARKMIGVIGVASSEKPPTGTPGRHGGNLDTRLITEGATVYLPVEFEGALLGVGDLHAVMGDGEVCVAACEAPGRVLRGGARVGREDSGRGGRRRPEQGARLGLARRLHAGEPRHRRRGKPAGGPPQDGEG